MHMAIFAISISVLMHVTWNLLARQTDPKSNFLWWAVAGHLVIFGPWSVWSLITEVNWNVGLVMAILIGGCANAAYLVALKAAYLRAPVALVYPIARSSPLLIAVWSVIFFGEKVSLFGWFGIAVSVLGLFWLGSTVRGGEPSKAIPWAVLAAVGTSVYSLTDKVVVVHLPTFGSQLGLVSVSFLFGFFALSVGNFRDCKKFYPKSRPGFVFLMIGSLFVGNAYALVIHAMLYLPAAYVVTFTNAGLALATLLSIFFLGERERAATRLKAVVVISFGIVCVGLASG